VDRIARTCSDAVRAAQAVVQNVGNRSSLAETSAAKDALAKTEHAAILIKNKVGFDEGAHHQKYRGMWRKGINKAIIPAKMKSWAIASVGAANEPYGFGQPKNRVHPDDESMDGWTNQQKTRFWDEMERRRNLILTWIFLLNEQVESSGSATVSFIEQPLKDFAFNNRGIDKEGTVHRVQEHDDVFQAEFDCNGEMILFADLVEILQVSAAVAPVQAVQAVQAAVSPRANTAGGAEWEVVYPDGITYRALPSWDDKLPEDYPVAQCGTKFQDPEEETTEGILYIAGDSGFWLPTTTANGKVVIKKTGGQPVSQPVSSGYSSSAGGAAEPWAVGPAPVQQQPVRKEPVLAAGWQALEDPSSGKPYYFNQGTGVTQWEFPESEPVAKPAAQPLHRTEFQRAPVVSSGYHSSAAGAAEPWGAQPQAQSKPAAASASEKDTSFLMDMGFGTKDQCARMLSKCDGNVDKAVQCFLSGDQA